MLKLYALYDGDYIEIFRSCFNVNFCISLGGYS